MESVHEKKTTLDDVFTKFSLFKPYHLRLALLVSLAFLSNEMYCSNFIFVTTQVDYRCTQTLKVCEGKLEKNVSDSNKACYKEVVPIQDAQCLVDNTTLETEVPCTQWVYDEPDSFVAEFGLACEEWKRTIPGTIHSTGYMLGLLIIGPISDRLGRKVTIITTAVLGGVFGLLRSFTTIYWLYILFEFFEALIGDSCSPMFMLAVESVASKDRGLFYTITQFGYPLGGMLLALVAYNVQYWRTYLRVIYAPALLFTLYVFLIDESPRWLLSKGEKEKAITIIEKAAKFNNTTVDKNILENLHTEQDKESKISIGELLKITFKSRVILLRFVVCVYWWLSNCFMAYGMALDSVSLHGNKYLNFGLATLMDIPAGVLTGVALKVSRKRCLMITYLAAAVFCLSQPFMPSDYEWLSLCLFLAGRCMSTLSFNVLYVYTSELFPTYTRNSMHALCSSLGRIGSIAAQQTPLLIMIWIGLPSMLFGGVSLVASLLAILMPDTIDVELPDSVQDAEAVGPGPQTWEKDIVISEEMKNYKTPRRDSVYPGKVPKHLRFSN